MPLDNTAKLADIITALQTMEGINAKAELASVVGSPANADDTMATINSVIQGAKNTLAAKMDDGSSGAEPLQGLIEKLFVGKKWASGNTISSNSTVTTTLINNNTRSEFTTLSVTGLSFRPSKIFVYASYVSYVTSSIYSLDWGKQEFSDVVALYGNFNPSSAEVAAGYLAKANHGVFSVRNDGFVIPVRFTTLAYNWIAFE